MIPVRPATSKALSIEKRAFNTTLPINHRSRPDQTVPRTMPAPAAINKPPEAPLEDVRTKRIPDAEARSVGTSQFVAFAGPSAISENTSLGLARMFSSLEGREVALAEAALPAHTGPDS
jgi:hypothetical protein